MVFFIVSWPAIKKWIHYDNPKLRRQWSKPGHVSTSSEKLNIHGSKFLLCIWRDQLATVYYELLKSTETIMGVRYRLQLTLSSRAIKKKGHYMSRDTSKWFCNSTTLGHVLQNRWKPTWKRLNGNPSPPTYSPDIASSNYHLFRSMADDLAEHRFHSYEDAKKCSTCS